ncbi:MAG: SUMF1/EgtB/PvdO family nonheme iron enzyme [Bacteroidetes bacterium]|nr:SUMF1/EgtB/PvdO family nonheme iron enzyme [Bacteroidota bacterium]
MKKLILIFSLAVVLAGCGGGNKGQLTGVLNRPSWYQPDPYGMVFIPSGSYTMGPSDQDVPYALTSQSRTVSVHAFYMDETEITNNEYRQFVDWVRDSIAHKLIAEEHIVNEGEYGEMINWRKRIKWDDEDNEEKLAEMFLPESERFYKRKEIDSRKLNYEYYWIDLKAAAQKFSAREQGKTDRSVFIKKDIINVYPDTLSWMHDYTYSFNEPMTEKYFWHPAYDDYPVVGVSWKQARAFCIWRTNFETDYLDAIEEPFHQNYRLPTEAEWEYASRGGQELNPYPWGGPYIRNSLGCFLANYKPMRGNYTDDGGFYTVKVTSYWPNDYGLYCMSGNVAEWCRDAYEASGYNITHDLNADYEYDEKEGDLPSVKRKLIRGGSWKDIGYYLQTGTRSWEFSDTAKCYVGFRCVQSFLGRDKSDF